MSPPHDPRGEEEARSLLHSLINKNLRISTADSRMFWGKFICTDHVSHSLTSPILNPNKKRKKEKKN